MSDRVDVAGTIKLDDKASPTIRQIQNGISKVTEQARKMGASVSRVANMGAFGGLAKNVRNTAGAMAGLGKNILAVGGSLAGLVGVAGFAGLITEMHSYVSVADELGDTAEKIGVTAEQLQMLRHAAKLSGVEAASLDIGMQQLNKRLAVSAAAKKPDELAQMFARLGIGLRDSKGQIRSAADVMPQLANAFEKNTNAAVRTRLAMAAFGKSGVDLIPMLIGGGAELQNMMAEMVRLGIITNEQVARAKELDDAQVRMNTALKGVSNTIAATLVPALLPVVEQFTEWLVINREWLAAGVGKAVKDLGTALAQVPWEKVVEGGKKMGAMLKTTFDLLGGVNAILPTFATILGGVVLKAISGVALALVQLTAAFVTNPIGAAIAAIAVAAYLIYKNWDKIGPYFWKLWAGVKAAFDAVWPWLEPFLNLFAPYLIYKHWDTIVTFFSNLWGKVKPVFDAVLPWLNAFISLFTPTAIESAWNSVAGHFTDIWAGVKSVFDTVFAWLDPFVSRFVPGGLIGAWRIFTTAFAALWNAPGAVFDAALERLNEFVAGFVPGGLVGVWEGATAALSTIWNAPRVAFDAVSEWFGQFVATFDPAPITAAWAGVTGFFKTLWNGVSGTFQTAWAIIKPIIDAIVAAVAPLSGAIGTITDLFGKARNALGGIGSSIMNGARGLLPGGGATPSAAPGGMPSPVQSVSPVQAAAAAAPAQVARVDGEVQTNIKISLAPGLLATATTQDKGRVASSVDTGQSMVPA